MRYSVAVGLLLAALARIGAVARWSAVALCRAATVGALVGFFLCGGGTLRHPLHARRCAWTAEMLAADVLEGVLLHLISVVVHGHTGISHPRSTGGSTAPGVLQTQHRNRAE
jgi:hypothetical protein